MRPETELLDSVSQGPLPRDTLIQSPVSFSTVPTDGSIDLPQVRTRSGRRKALLTWRLLTWHLPLLTDLLISPLS